jgi:predicted flavoprotein YhiN
VSTPVVLTVRTHSGKRVASCRGSLLCTHFGVSGPAVLDVSRHLAAAKLEDAGVQLVCDWLPDATADRLASELRAPGPVRCSAAMRGDMPERLAARCAPKPASIRPCRRANSHARHARRSFAR